jgi:membrane-associated protein
MHQFRVSWQKNALRFLAWSSLFTLVLASCQECAFADEIRGFIVPEKPGEEAGLWGFVAELVRNLFDGHALMHTLGKPEYTILAFIALNIIVFVETGLLVGFFLPGDSLLVITGLICSNPECGWNMPLLLLTLCLSAIIGDSIGYSIGYKTGPKIFNREGSFFFHKDHLLKAQQFYENHGGKTIVLARFMPILRTFAPVVAGVGKMEYRQFLFFNIIGGVSWVCSMVLAGYFLPRLLNPVLQSVFGPEFLVQEHVEKVVIIVVLLSIAPGLFAWLKSKLASKAPLPQQEPAALAK